MAKRTTTRPPPEPPRPAALTMSRTEADAKLATRIEKAETLRQRLGPSSDSLTGQEEYDKWNAYNWDMLLRMFTDETIARQYDWSSPPAPVLNLGGETWLGTARRERADPTIAEKLDTKVAALLSIRERLEVYEEPAPTTSSAPLTNRNESAPARQAAFIVHGHDGEAREATARVLEALGVEPIILHERPNGGGTILEKFEKHSAAAPYAIVLLTGDDEGGKAGDLHPRARQNVILELGFFWGSLGRERLCVLYERGVELPSDLHGLVHVEIDKAGAWRYQLAAELRSVWPDIDLNLLHAQ
jgi:predicted nucleotide-binding protein